MKVPKCTIATRHRWIRNGGCDGNPGVWGIGGNVILTREECEHCGLVRERVLGDSDTGPMTNRNHDWEYHDEGFGF